MPRMGSLYIFTIAHHSLPGVVIKTDGAPHFWHTLQWYRSSGRQWLFHADTYLKGESLESFSRDPYPDYMCSDGEPMVSVFSGKLIPEGTYGTGRMIAVG